MNNYNVEKQADELLTALGKELAKSRVAYADAILDKNTPNPPFYMEPSVKKKGSKRMFRKTLILVAVFTIIMGLIVVSSEGVREKMLNYFFTVKPGHTDVQPLEKGEKEGEIPEFELDYVPEGYEKINEEDYVGIGWLIDYRNDKNQYINLMVMKSEAYSSSIDNDTLRQKEITINGTQAYLFIDERNSVLIWQIGDYVLQLSTGLSESEVVKVAQNIEIKK